MAVGVRELKNNLSWHLRRLRTGDRIAVTAHGRVVAELVAPGANSSAPSDRYAALVADGTIRAPLESGDPLEGVTPIRLPRGTVARLIDEDRGEN